MNHSLLMLALLIVPTVCLAQEPLPAGGDPTVIGQVEHEGYGLVGSRGRFYLFGGIAMADYSDSAGTRRIVTLQREDQIQDEKHVYYRELREGHRWAFSRERGSDGMHGVWVQLAAADPAAPPKWQPFQRARMESPREAGALAPTGLSRRDVAVKACCAM
jgi:hypothetical protein